MDKQRASILLSSAVEGLGPQEKANLRYHQAVGTPVVCGPGSELLWTDGAGGACPVLLAAFRELPEERWDEAEEVRVPNWVRNLFRRFNRSAGSLLLQALASLDQEEAWAAIGEGLA